MPAGAPFRRHQRGSHQGTAPGAARQNPPRSARHSAKKGYGRRKRNLWGKIRGDFGLRLATKDVGAALLIRDGNTRRFRPRTAATATSRRAPRGGTCGSWAAPVCWQRTIPHDAARQRNALVAVLPLAKFAAKLLAAHKTTTCVAIFRITSRGPGSPVNTSPRLSAGPAPISPQFSPIRSVRVLSSSRSGDSTVHRRGHRR